MEKEILNSGENSISLNRQIGNLISENINLNFFFNLDIDKTRIKLLGYYSEELERYLLKKNFDYHNYLYRDDKDKIEYKLENIHVVLFMEN